MLRRRPLSILLLSGCPLLALAEPTPDPAADPRRALDTIVVTANKVEDPIGDVAATVSAIDAAEIERQLARDIKDLVRYEPGVSVRNEVGRFGLSGFNIRGLGGNRVAVEIDGVPIADAFAIGSFSNATRSAVDIDLLKQVEIVRGPASSLYGSDALGGVVGLVTRDPHDYLQDAETRSYGRLRIGAWSVDDSWAASGLAAGRSGPWSFMAMAGTRRGHARDNFGDNAARDSTRTLPNPQDYDDRSFLGKLLFEPAPGHRLRLSLDALRSESDTEVLSSLGSSMLGPSRVTVEDQTGHDESDRQRWAFDYRIDSANILFDGAQLLAWRQDSETLQDTFERRTTVTASGAASSVERERRFLFDQGAAGVELLFHRQFSLGGTEHRLVWGAERSQTDTEQLRDGLQRDLASGAESPMVLPDVFPVRDFPLSEVREEALFLQDRIRFAEGRFELQPGLRWDRVSLDPRIDPIFEQDNPGVGAESLRHSELSPKLATLWRLSPAWSLHGQWAEGFRAPPYSDVNVGFTNLQFGYTAIPNPDLQPETSRGTELGLRWRGEAGFAALSLYRNRYADFIESLVALGPDPSSGLLVFQSQNLTDVRIEGAELRVGLYAGALLESLEGWRLNAALSRARGDDLSGATPLDSIDPAKAVLGLGYTTMDGRWDAELVATAVERKKRIADPEAFRSPGHLLLDLLVQWRPLPRLTLSAGVFNLADRKVWEWADVRGRSAADPVIDRFTQPGRNAGVNLVFEF